MTKKLGEIALYFVCPQRHLQGTFPATFTLSLKITGKVLILVHTIYTTFTESLVRKVCACLTQKTEGLPACVNWLTAHVGTFYPISIHPRSRPNLWWLENPRSLADAEAISDSVEVNGGPVAF
jgi:hypothetical protein